MEWDGNEPRNGDASSVCHGRSRQAVLFHARIDLEANAKPQNQSRTSHLLVDLVEGVHIRRAAEQPFEHDDDEDDRNVRDEEVDGVEEEQSRVDDLRYVQVSVLSAMAACTCKTGRRYITVDGNATMLTEEREMSTPSW